MQDAMLRDKVSLGHDKIIAKRIESLSGYCLSHPFAFRISYFEDTPLYIWSLLVKCPPVDDLVGVCSVRAGEIVATEPVHTLHGDGGEGAAALPIAGMTPRDCHKVLGTLVLTGSALDNNEAESIKSMVGMLACKKFKVEPLIPSCLFLNPTYG